MSDTDAALRGLIDRMEAVMPAVERIAAMESQLGRLIALDAASPVDLMKLSIARLDVEPGETLIIKWKGELTHEQHRHIHEWASHVFPAGVKFAIIDDRADISVCATRGFE